jgi:hypothetical protein
MKKKILEKKVYLTRPDAVKYHNPRPNWDKPHYPASRKVAAFTNGIFPWVFLSSLRTVGRRLDATLPEKTDFPSRTLMVVAWLNKCLHANQVSGLF